MPIEVRPLPTMAFLYYLNSLNPDIVVIIQSMVGGIPTALDISILTNGCL